MGGGDSPKPLALTPLYKKIHPYETYPHIPTNLQRDLNFYSKIKQHLLQFFHD